MLYLRDAGTVDADLLLAWRNDPLTRANSFNSREVTREEHVRWLQDVIASPDRLLFVALRDGRPVGTCRADREDGGWELSWTVAPDARGQGIGEDMVRALRAKLKGPCKAKIKPGNTASRRIAAAAGLEVIVLLDTAP